MCRPGSAPTRPRLCRDAGSSAGVSPSGCWAGRCAGAAAPYSPLQPTPQPATTVSQEFTRFYTAAPMRGARESAAPQTPKPSSAPSSQAIA
eukprot:5033835-Prymnesium_polylepis.1